MDKTFEEKVCTRLKTEHDRKVSPAVVRDVLKEWGDINTEHPLPESHAHLTSIGVDSVFDRRVSGPVILNVIEAAKWVIQAEEKAEKHRKDVEKAFGKFPPLAFKKTP